MKSIIFKKTITSIYLLMFLFTLFIPFNQINAQTEINLEITTASPIIKTDTYAKITAKLTQYSLFSTTPEIYFYSNPKVAGFDGVAYCKPVYITGDTTKFFCDVNFRSSAEGTYKITAHNNGNKYVAQEITIEVKKDITPPPTPPAAIKPNTTYTPLAPLPGLGDDGTAFETDKSKSACPFGNYLNIMIKLILGIAAVLAMVMITMGGIQYMTSDLISSKEAGKETVTNAILGLLIGLGAWLILNTINPALLSACLDNLPQAEIIIEPESAHEQIVLTNIKNFKGKNFTTTSYFNDIKTIASSKFPHCMMQATILIESAGKTSQVIGHDENVRGKNSNNIKSRRDFVQSGKTFKGVTFTTTTDTTISQQNDDGKNSSTAPNSNDTYLGLDYTRFSHSVGMFGITFFPPDGHITDKSGTTMKEIYNNTNNADIKWAVNFMSKVYTQCGNDPLKTFKAWGGGGCNSTKPFVLAASAAKLDLYNQCLKLYP